MAFQGSIEETLGINLWFSQTVWNWIFNLQLVSNWNWLRLIKIDNFVWAKLLIEQNYQSKFALYMLNFFYFWLQQKKRKKKKTLANLKVRDLLRTFDDRNGYVNIEMVDWVKLCCQQYVRLNCISDNCIDFDLFW